MKLESRKKVRVKSCEFGGSAYQIFGSVEPATRAELERLIAEGNAANIGVLEIVLNRYDSLADFSRDLKACKTTDLPISLRIKRKGTDDRVEQDTALAVLSACVQEKLADIIDVEADDQALAEQAKCIVANSDTKLLLTLQNYQGAKSVEEVLQAARDVASMDPDLLRVLVLAADDVDMLHIAQAAKQAKRQDSLELPFCISAIGEAGLMLRLFGERCGNDFGSYPLRRKAEGDFTFETMDEYKRLRAVYNIGKQSCGQESGDAG